MARGLFLLWYVLWGSSSFCRAWHGHPQSEVAEKGDFFGCQRFTSKTLSTLAINSIPRGGLLEGLNPFGYALTELGRAFLKMEGCADTDLGKFLSSLKTKRKTTKALKDQWLEVVRQAKSGQSMRIYRTMDDLIDFALKAGFIN